jgi:paraquat-inducible protein A
MSYAELIACRECDYLHESIALQPFEKAYCVRCGAMLGVHRDVDLIPKTAITVTGFIVWLLAVTLPIASVIIQGHQINATLSTIVQTLNLQQYTALAFLIIFTLGISPLLELGAISFILWQLHLKNNNAIDHTNLALAEKIRGLIKPWVLVDVFMLGVLVALVKLKSIVIIELNAGLWAFISLMLLLYYLSFTLTVSHDTTYDE